MNAILKPDGNRNISVFNQCLLIPGSIIYICGIKLTILNCGPFNLLVIDSEKEKINLSLNDIEKLDIDIVYEIDDAV